MPTKMKTVMTCKVEGLEELNEALAEMADDIARKTLFNSLRAAIRPLRDEARAKAPVGSRKHWVGLKSRGEQVDPGNLRDFGFKVQRMKNPRFAAYLILRYSGKAFYGKFFELGTAKMRAQPILAPVFDTRAQDSLEIFRKRLEERVEAVRAKHASQG